MNKTRTAITSLMLLLVVGMFSCSVIEEGGCKMGYLNYQYLNNVGENATYPYLNKVTDFIYTKDSVLFRVDENITNGKIAKRPITLPDGEWIVYSYANLNGGSTVSPYVIGKTRLSEMSVRVSAPPSYTGTYAPSVGDEPTLQTGDADRIYFGKVALRVKDGTTDRAYLINFSNVHIWLSGTVRLSKSMSPSYGEDKNMHIRLEYVPVAYNFMNDDKMDNLYKIPYSTPRITSELATQPIKLVAGTSAQEYTFQMYGLRWETGRAPVLRIYNGETMLVEKDLPLNKYFDEQGIDLTQIRVQFFNLIIQVDGQGVVTISDITINDWEDGGFIG